MKFFTPEDFPVRDLESFGGLSYNAANIANLKLEREGKMVYLDRGMSEIHSQIKKESDYTLISSNFKNTYYKALIINIEPIEQCKHPSHKVAEIRYGIEGGLVVDSLSPSGFSLPGKKELLSEGLSYKCECGAIVKPKEYEEVK